MTDENGIVRQEAELLLYQTEDGFTGVEEVRFAGETLWLSLKQMSELCKPLSGFAVSSPKRPSASAS